MTFRRSIARPNIEICEQSERRREEAQRHTRPRTFIAVPPDASNDTPALIALHAWGWNGKDALAAWQSVVDAGYVLIAPRSSQLSGSGEYCWDNLDLALREIAEAFSTVVQQQAFDRRRVAIGGYSQGAGVAMVATVARIIPWLRGWVALAPGFASDGARQQLTRMVRALPREEVRELRAWTLVGARDPLRSDVEALNAELQGRGMRSALLVEDGVGHRLRAKSWERSIEGLGFVVA